MRLTARAWRIIEGLGAAAAILGFLIIGTYVVAAYITTGA